MAFQDHKGLGDTVAAITKRLAIDKLAKAVAKAAGKEDCGCSKRQETLNNMFPYNSDRNARPKKQ